MLSWDKVWNQIKEKKEIIAFFSLVILFSGLFWSWKVGGEEDNTEVLKSLHYVTWSEDSYGDHRTGTVFHDKNKSYEGINIFCSQDSATGYLSGMSGENIDIFKAKKLEGFSCDLFDLYSNHSFLMLTTPSGLIKINKDSSISFVKRKVKRFLLHHDFDSDEQGRIFILGRKPIFNSKISSEWRFYDDNILILSPKGELIDKLSITDLILKEDSLTRLAREVDDRISFNDGLGIWIAEHFISNDMQLLSLSKSWENQMFSRNFKHPILILVNYTMKFLFNLLGVTVQDVLHSNTVKLIHERIDYGNGLVFEKGNALVCVRNLNLIGVVSLEDEEFVWWWGPGNLDLPHNPTMLDNGNILIFDNGPFRGYSRVIELNPATEQIEWEYISKPPSKFLSPVKGSAQRLPNNNTLITDSQKGHVFEVTKDKEIVWEFWNPRMDEEGRRAVIYRMKRLNKSYLDNKYK